MIDLCSTIILDIGWRERTFYHIYEVIIQNKVTYIMPDAGSNFRCVLVDMLWNSDVWDVILKTFLLKMTKFGLGWQR